MQLLPCIPASGAYHAVVKPTKAAHNKPISPFLQSLLSVSHRSDSADRPHTSYLIPSFTAPGTRKGKEAEVVPRVEELSWTKSQVVWSKGGSIYQTFTFREQGQDIVQAIFAWFEVSLPTASSSSSTTAAFNDTTSTFGPFQRPPPPAWTDDPLALPVDPTASQPPAPTRLERSLVIFLSDVAFVYPPSGGSFPFQLPFHLRRAWAMDKGILLERDREGKEVFGATGEAESGTLYSLLSPADEIRVVSSTPSLSNLFSTTPSNLAKAASPTVPVQDLHDRLIFASDRRDGSEPILVSLNKRSMSVSVWSYGRVGTELSPAAFSPDDRGAGTEAMRKAASRETDRMDDTPMSLSRPRRKRSSITNAPTIQASSSDRDRERLQRRPSAVNGAGAFSTARAGAEEADLLEALGESIGANAMTRTASALSSMSAADRRGSVTRNELSITMDRMALGVGSNIGLAANSVIGGEMDREATLFIDEGEQARMMSDVMVEKGWEVDLTRGGPDGLDDASAYIVDSRNDSDSSVTSTLAILLPHSETLLVFSIRRSAEGKVVLRPMQQIPAIAAATILATRSSLLDLIVVAPDQTWGVIGTASVTFKKIIAPELMPRGKKIIRLEGDGSTNISITFDDQSRYVTSAPAPPAGLALRCLQGLSLVLPLQPFAAIYNSILAEKASSPPGSSYLDAIAATVKSVTIEIYIHSAPIAPLNRICRSSAHDYLFTGLRSSNQTTSSLPPRHRPSILAEDTDVMSLLEAMLMSLHLIAEDSKLLAETQQDFESLLPILMLLSSKLGLSNWLDYYKRASGINSVVLDSTRSVGSRLNKSPINIMDHLQSRLINAAPPSTSISFESVATLFDYSPSFFYGMVDPLRTTVELLSVYETLSITADGTSVSARAQKAVLQLFQLGWKLEDVGRLVVGISLPLREAIRLSQLESPDDWPPEAYELIRRPDLARQNGGKAVERHKHFVPKSSDQPAIDVICDSSLAKTGISGAFAEEVNRLSKATKFGEDRRLEEVERMLQFSDPVTISGGDRLLESLTPPVQQGILLALSNRTLSLPIGYAMFNYRSQLEPSSESVPIHRINLSARILPMTSVVAYVEKERGDVAGSLREKDRMEWPEFHSGVAAALELGFDDEDFDSSQISFNRPQDLDARHAGFLMGLGLMGKISRMVSNQAFEYLKMKHDPTSIGLLLGLAVTYLGTGDAKVTRLLSIHLSALHPPDSSPLNVSGITQAAGLAGIGLLYLGTAKRTLADLMIKELCGITVTNVEDPTACREAYALSAGFAFGLIMLAKGKELTGEVLLLRTFRALILGDANRTLPGFRGDSTMTDVNITSSAAAIALSLMFLRSERQDVADLLEIPETTGRLNYVRADLLLLRTLGHSLIMWTSVSTSREWVESHLPIFLRAAFAASIQTSPYDTDLGIAAWNIIAGACFGMGLKFAGTARKEAHVTLIYYLDRLTRAAYVKAGTVQGKIKRHAIRCCLSVVAMSLAMVMAGTGELNVLRRLRIAHGHFSEGVTYGTHLSSHMALGLLFLGSGQYTLGTSDLAIAALVIALYPSFPPTPIENRAHLQAYRHLWTLAVEPRCVIARDVDTNEASFLPIRLRINDLSAPTASGGSIKVLDLVAPTLIPELRRIDTILIDSPRYWSFSLHLSTNPAQMRKFLSDSTLYVKRRTGHLSYSQDPRGNRSIFTRSKSETGSSVIDFGETARVGGMGLGTTDGLRDFVRSFSADQVAIAMVEYLCPKPTMTTAETSEYEAFTASVLLECLTKDKPDTIGIYQALFAAFSNSVWRSTRSLLDLEQLRLATNFYQGGYYSKVFKVKSKSGVGKSPKEPLIQRTFIEHLVGKTRARSAQFLEEPGTRQILLNYLREYEWPIDASGLAKYLAAENAPDLNSLIQLRGLVTSVGGSGNEGVKGAIKLIVRGAAKDVQSKGGKPWSNTFGDILVDVWLN